MNEPAARTLPRSRSTRADTRLRALVVLAALTAGAALHARSVHAQPAAEESRRRPAGAVVGEVVDDGGRPIEAARVETRRSDGALPSAVLSDARGAFRITGLAPGIYDVTVRRIGYRAAELTALRVVADTVVVRVILSSAPRRLSTVVIRTTATSVDAGTPEISARVDREAVALLPGGRTATSFTELVPGARDDQLWGGAGGTANDYRIDGVSVSHPGTGGDFLALSADWIESLDVRGPAAGAEYGNFQGGIVDAVTRTGTNRRRAVMRANYESPRLSATNFNLDEEGAEQAGRRELAGEFLGPVVRDRLFYFAAGQLVDRDVRAPDLASRAPTDFLGTQEGHRDARGLLKLTWVPTAGDHVDVMVGGSSRRIEHAGINGVDAPDATQRVRAPSAFFEAAWTTARHARSALDVRVAGFTARETRRGYAGPDVPSVWLMGLGRQPAQVNARFDERQEPSSVGASATWRASTHALGADHRLVTGAELVAGSWRDTRTRNGGLTWRPYAIDAPTGFDPADARTWGTTASEWGGDVDLRARVSSGAVFVQDYLSLGTRVTLAPGLRWGAWSGWLTPSCRGAPDPIPAARCGDRFRAVRASALAPRVGASWDVTGRSDLAVKAHWGRFHQAMLAPLFDRAAGGDARTDRLFYYSAPPLTTADPRFTAAERDALTGPGGFSTFHDTHILGETGRVEGYRQPYVDQATLAVEKAFGRRWKAEALYLHRVNRDVVGLVDRNLAGAFQELRDVRVEHRLGFGQVLDASGRPLVLPTVYVANADIVAVLEELMAGGIANPVVAGFSPADIPRLQATSDIVLTTIPQARRRYRQLTLSLRAEHDAWRGQGSITVARLDGNVAGMAAYGTADGVAEGTAGGVAGAAAGSATGSRFTAGPFVRPNEALNYQGTLPGSPELEAKLWATARLPFRLVGGAVATHVLGERFTPTFELAGRYRYESARYGTLPDNLFRRVHGQVMFLEPRGSRHYASRSNLDLHLERAFGGATGRRIVAAADLFNAIGSTAVTRVRTWADDQELGGSGSYLGAPLRRVAPRRLRIGVRVE